MTEYEFQEAVEDEQKESPCFDGIKGLTVDPHIHEFVKEVEQVILDTDMADKGKGELGVLFRTGEGKFDRKTIHEVVRPGVGRADMPRRETQEVAGGKIIGSPVNGIAGGTSGEVSKTPGRKEAFLDLPDGGGFSKDTIIYLRGNTLIYFREIRERIPGRWRYLKLRRKGLMGEESFIRLKQGRIPGIKWGGGGVGGV
jgi:hypothetical protein